MPSGYLMVEWVLISWSIIVIKFYKYFYQLSLSYMINLIQFVPRTFTGLQTINLLYLRDKIYPIMLWSNTH